MLLVMLLASQGISRRSRVRDEPPVVAPPDVAGGPLSISAEGPLAAAADNSVQTMKVDMSRSPNATVAQMFMSQIQGAQWAQMPIGIPSRHDPLLSTGVVQEPTLLKIDEMNDAGGALGSTYIVWGLGPFVMFKGTWKSRHFGHNRIRATIDGVEAFQLSDSKHKWNPAKMRYSYRVLAPKPALKSYDVKFTINRDLFGRGFFGIKDEYRIYKGRERNGHMVYYCGFMERLEDQMLAQQARVRVWAEFGHYHWNTRSQDWPLCCACSGPKLGGICSRCS
jgi:hypothetical protein